MPGVWPWIICIFNAWKWVGYNSIIYIAAITSIDAECYEAADIDMAPMCSRKSGISRFRPSGPSSSRCCCFRLDVFCGATSRCSIKSLATTVSFTMQRT